MHAEVLTPKAQALFPKLSRFTGFYLAGGTALALQIGHRRSVDFDMFTPEVVPPRLLAKVKQVFPHATIATTYAAPDQLNVLVDGVKCTFLHYNYPMNEPCVMYESVPLASIREIAAMKAFAIGRRLSYKDYIDWYFLLADGYLTLTEAIAQAQQKFKGDFNDRLFVGQLASLDDIEEVPIEFVNKAVTKATVARFLKEEIQKIL